MRVIIILIFLASFLNGFSQGIKGSWYGSADILLGGSHNNYLVELDLKQEGNDVKGVISYYFKQSFQSFYVKGTYNAGKREITIKNIPITYFRASASNGVECIMDLKAIVTASRVSTNIKGVFTTQGKYKYTCPDIAFDFVYGEQLNTDSLIDKFSPITKMWKPTEEDVVVNPQEDRTPDSVDLKVKEPTFEQLEAKKIQVEFNKRAEVVTKELLVDSDSLRLTFYDNGIVDGDSISVFYNKEPISTHQSLTERGIIYYVVLDPSKPYNEISMFAENLGTIAPNTALMVITDGINRYEVFLSSSLSQNSTVRIRRRR
ncbi:hypothetical protein DC498_20880 [Terrimonas sp.]|uniref:hypothetical protein n=1 Tax=Terrimonas sp. TaxID=1914338 RepID=UPI000D5252D2|nr:hypothetical protein [Terrimonas sp.]PVD50299.1 hypothetical protein DC498_20880 [Terrimonas sp.]